MLVSFQSEIENLSAEITNYEELIAAKRLEIKRFQTIEKKVFQGAKLLEEALALATQHGYPEKAVATIQSRFTSLGLSTSTTNSEELARIIDDRDSLLVRIANESERHYKEIVRLNEEKSKAADQYEQRIDQLDKECHGLHKSYDRLAQERHQQQVEIESYQRWVARLKKELVQSKASSIDGEQQQMEEAPILEAIALLSSPVEQQSGGTEQMTDSSFEQLADSQTEQQVSWEKLSDRVWHCPQTSETVVSFQKKAQALAWGEKLNSFLGAKSEEIAPITGAPNGFKYELRVFLSGEDAKCLASQDLNAEPHPETMCGFPGNVERQGVLAQLVERLKKAQSQDDLNSIKADRRAAGIEHEELVSRLSSEELARVKAIRQEQAKVA